MAFTAGHVQAIIGLGGQNPSQHWAEFDVSVGHTIDNAIALCPNCHRGAHLGGYIGDSAD